MAKRQNLIGMKFERLLVVSEATPRRNKKGVVSRYWKCECDCGSETEVSTKDLNSRHTKSCGCLLTESITKHGMSGTRTYSTWKNMKMRCKTDGSHPSQEHYGLRGISVCDRWLNSFENFYEDMGERPEGMSIERIDVNGNYEPSNCKWVTQKEQLNNTTKTIYLEYQGETHNLDEWSKILNMTRTSILARYYKGVSFEDIVNKNFGESQYWVDDGDKEKTLVVGDYTFKLNINGDITVEEPYRVKMENKRRGLSLRIYKGKSRVCSFSPAKLLCAAFIDENILTNRKLCVYFNDGNQKNLSVENLSIITRGYQLHLRHKGEGV